MKTQKTKQKEQNAKQPKKRKRRKPQKERKVYARLKALVPLFPCGPQPPLATSRSAARVLGSLRRSPFPLIEQFMHTQLTTQSFSMCPFFFIPAPDTILYFSTFSGNFSFGHFLQLPFSPSFRSKIQSLKVLNSGSCSQFSSYKPFPETFPSHQNPSIYTPPTHQIVLSDSVDDSVNSSTTVSRQLLNGSSTDLASLGPIRVFFPFRGGGGVCSPHA